MSKNLLIPTCVLTILATGGFAGYSAFEYNKGVEADRYYASVATTLQNNVERTIAVSMRAARDTSYTGELEQLASAVNQAINSLGSGNMSAGIPPAPESIDSALRSLMEPWASVEMAVESIAASRETNSTFSRQSAEARSVGGQLQNELKAAMALIEGNGQVDERARKALTESWNDLRSNLEIVTTGTDSSAEALRIAHDSAAAFISVVAQYGNLMPRDPALINPLLAGYRTAQNFQRVAWRALESSSGQVDNAPHAQAIWAARTNLNSALTTLQHAINSLPQTRPINGLILTGAIGIFLFTSLASLLLILRNTSARMKQAETMGTSIRSSQKERSTELALLLEEMERVAAGDLTQTITTGKDSTDEIASVLNDVFGFVRSLVQDVQQTIVNLSAASEQTLTMARNVNRNHNEQDRAISHITSLVQELGSFTDQTDTLTNTTRESSQQVTEQVKNGSKAVQEVHEGVMKLSQSNMNIMHHTKAMTENIQNLERLVDVVKKVASQSTSLAFNAHLVADAVDDDRLSKRIRVSAEAMTQLATHANEASEQITAALSGINSAAKDTQYVLDDSQKEIQELKTRSDSALAALGAISEQTNELADHITSVMQQTSQLKRQSGQVSATIESIHHYATEQSAASEQTASAISNLNDQAQSVGQTLANFKV